MINTNLIVNISEDVVGGDPDAISLKTTTSGNVVIEMHCPKVAIKLKDLDDALKSIEQFLSKRPIVVEANSINELQPTFEFEYNPEQQQII